MKKEYIKPVCKVVRCKTAHLLSGSNEYGNNYGKIRFDETEVDASLGE